MSEDKNKVTEEDAPENYSEEDLENDKEERTRIAAQSLMSSIMEGTTSTLREKVAYILNKYPETRDSDITLQLKYWEEFENLNGNTISIKQLYDMEKLTSIVRARAKIQNEFNLFLATSRTRRFRNQREEDEKESALLDKPTVPLMHIYADETGKNDKYLMVGSIWVLDDRHNGQLNTALSHWTEQMKIENEKYPKEFHFRELNNQNNDELNLYKGFFDELMNKSEMISFRAIAVDKTKLSIPLDELIQDLFYRLIIIGLEYEIQERRIVFPKQISYLKDEDNRDNSYNILTFSELLIDKLNENYGNDILLNKYSPIPSRISRLIQQADLFTGSLNRIYNHRPINKSNNNKDKLADYILNKIKIKEVRHSVDDLEGSMEGGSSSDMATIHIYE